MCRRSKGYQPREPLRVIDFTHQDMYRYLDLIHTAEMCQSLVPINYYYPEAEEDPKCVAFLVKMGRVIENNLAPPEHELDDDKPREPKWYWDRKLYKLATSTPLRAAEALCQVCKDSETRCGGWDLLRIMPRRLPFPSIRKGLSGSSTGKGMLHPSAKRPCRLSFITPCSHSYARTCPIRTLQPLSRWLG